MESGIEANNHVEVERRRKRKEDRWALFITFERAFSWRKSEPRNEERGKEETGEV